MRSLKTLMDEAARSSDSLKLECDKTKSFVMRGTKIMYDKPTDTIILLNLTKSGDWFSKMKEDEVFIFKKNGWEKGVYMTALKNYSRKLLNIETTIKGEINTRKNEKRFRKLKESRRRYLNKYAETKQKLNRLLNKKSKDNGNSKQKKLLY